MSTDRAAFLDKLKSSYEYYYDVEAFDADSSLGLPIAITAECHIRDEGYVLVKKAKIWAAESNEYVYIFSAPSFDKATVSKCVGHALADAGTKIKPHSEHKNSFIIAVFVADLFDAGAQKEIRVSKFDKSYKMGFHGWTALKTAAVDTEKEMVTANKTGGDLVKFFKKLLRSEKV